MDSREKPAQYSYREVINVGTKTYDNLVIEKYWMTTSKPKPEKATDVEDHKFLALST